LPINSRDDDPNAPDGVGDSGAHHSVAMLRGAPVEVNTRKVTQFVSALLIIALATLSVTFFVSGAHRNEDVSNLQRHGTLVSVTTTTCTGELGGSGSNLADYRCEGTFTLNGRHFEDTIPGHTLRTTGSTAMFVVAKNNPGLLATSHDVRSEKSSWTVYILPFVLLVVLIALVTFLASRRAHPKEHK
jgi:hypothetical protein